MMSVMRSCLFPVPGVIISPSHCNDATSTKRNRANTVVTALKADGFQCAICAHEVPWMMSCWIQTGPGQGTDGSKAVNNS